MIQESILELVKYGLTTGLVEKEDAVSTLLCWFQRGPSNSRRINSHT